MAGILDLDRNSFFGAMDELGIVGEQRDDLIRQYREKSSPVGLLMQAGETDPGMVRSDIMPFVRPEGMSLWDAWKSGDAEFAVPGFLTGAVSGSARAFDAPGAAGLGLIPEQDMAGEALGVAGLMQGGSAMGVAPDDALRAGLIRRQPGSFSILGSDYFAPANPNAGRSKDPAMFSPYSATKHTVAPNEFEVYGTDLGGLMSPNVVSPSEIQKIYDRIYFATGDRTSANRAIEQINDLILRVPGVTYGGPEYMDLLRAWASEPTAMAAKANALQEVPEGVRSLLAYMPMGERSGDFSKHMSDVYGAATKVKMAGNAAPSSADVTKINDLISKKFPKLKDVPSVASDQFADWLSGQKGGTRAKIIKAFDGADFKALGMPDVSAVRFAVTNPDLVKSDALSVGYRMSEPDASGGIVRSKEHPSYGAYLPMAEGTQNMTLGYELPWWIGARDTALQKIAPGGKTYALPKDIKSYMGNPRIYQNIDQQWVDEASSYGDLLASEGKKAADDYARNLLSDYWSRN
jgi:hypothetical protein